MVTSICPYRVTSICPYLETSMLPSSWGISWQSTAMLVPSPVAREFVKAAPITNPSAKLCSASPVKLLNIIKMLFDSASDNDDTFFWDTKTRDLEYCWFYQVVSWNLMHKFLLIYPKYCTVYKTSSFKASIAWWILSRYLFSSKYSVIGNSRKL